ncbi:hypothetical protein FOCC_FOCC012946 [Frankliniella occidentalis]|nr:hypothetical protein FOCC_FOCC012946 [Frankliniella occidentalis]
MTTTATETLPARKPSPSPPPPSPSDSVSPTSTTSAKMRIKMPAVRISQGSCAGREASDPLFCNVRFLGFAGGIFDLDVLGLIPAAAAATIVRLAAARKTPKEMDDMKLEGMEGATEDDELKTYCDKIQKLDVSSDMDRGEATYVARYKLNRIQKNNTSNRVLQQACLLPITEFNTLKENPLLKVLRCEAS